MNGRIVWRVMWKEYRALRGLWIAVAIASWLAQLAAVLLERQFGLLQVAYAAALITPVFYVFGVAAATFAGEREDGTDRLLRALPAPIGPLAVGKLLFVVLSTLAIVPAAGLLAVGELWWPSAGRFDPRGAMGIEVIWAPAILEGAVWGIFFSLVCRGVMQAATLAALAAATTVTLALHLTNDTTIGQVDPNQYARSLWLRLAIVGVVVAVDWALARNWLFDRAAQNREAKETSWLGLRGAIARTLAWGARAMRWQVRLLWLQILQSSRLMLLVIGVPIALSLLVPNFAERQQLTELSPQGILLVSLQWEITLVVVATFVGCMVFAADKKQRGYRCLAEQGSSAGAVWINRQAFGLSWLVAGVVLAHLVWWARMGITRNLPIAEFDAFNDYGYRDSGRTWWYFISWREVGSVAIVYAAGQLASLLLSSGMVATLVGLVLASIGYAWSLLMMHLQLPSALTVWPLALGMLATTAVFGRGWLIDQRGLKLWLQTAGTLAAFTALTLALIPDLRLQGIPDRPLAFDVAAFEATLGPAEQKTGDLYRRAFETMISRGEIEDNHAPLDEDPAKERREAIEKVNERWMRGELSDIDREWLAVNQSSIDLALEANQRPTCSFAGIALHSPSGSMHGLIDLLNVRAIARAGDLDAELAAYLDVLALTNHLRPSWEALQYAMYAERDTINHLLRWAAQPGQTPERLRTARRALQAHLAKAPSPADPIKLEYLQTLRRLENPTEVVGSPLAYLLDRLPWERERARLQLTSWTNERLDQAEQVAQLMSWRLREIMRDSYFDERPLVEIAATPALEGLDSRGFSYWYLERALTRSANLRAAIIILELMAFRLEQGKLPEALSELTELSAEELAPLTKDPFTDLPFEYFPNGLPLELDHNRPIGTKLRIDTQFGGPALWSPGIGVERTFDERDGKTTRRFSNFDSARRRRSLDNDLAGWTAGLIYPIPEPIAAPSPPAP
jgi:hypothetical protein